MDQTPLVAEEIDAGAQFVEAFDKYAEVSVAFWLKSADENRWYLYLASDNIDETNFDLGYEEVLRLARRIHSPYLSPFQIKLLGTSDRLAHAVLDVHKKYPGLLGIRYNRPSLGDISIDGAYLYPLKSTSAPK